jgi:hypothetical protein
MAYPVTNFVGNGGSDCVIMRGIAKRVKSVDQVKANTDDSIIDETLPLYLLGKVRIPRHARVVIAFIYIAEINVE